MRDSLENELRTESAVSRDKGHISDGSKFNPSLVGFMRKLLPNETFFITHLCRPKKARSLSNIKV